jgi:hypothetical protein
MAKKADENCHTSAKTSERKWVKVKQTRSLKKSKQNEIQLKRCQYYNKSKVIIKHGIYDVRRVRYAKANEKMTTKVKKGSWCEESSRMGFRDRIHKNLMHMGSNSSK